MDDETIAVAPGEAGLVDLTQSLRGELSRIQRRSGIMEEHKENTSQPRIPSDIRTYFFLLALAAITFVILWLVSRFI